MKLQTTKKLFAFIIIMMFSISFLNAQCSGNKIRLCKANPRSGYCVFTCVPKSQVQKYLDNGWGFICNCYTFPFAKKETNKRSSVKIIAENAIVSNKIFRR